MLRMRLVSLPLLLLTVGCGDDSAPSGSSADSSATSSPNASTFDDAGFRRQAERICTDFVKAQSATPPSDPDGVALFLEDQAIAVKAAFSRLSALQYPPTEEGQAVRTVLVDGVGKLQADFVTAVAEAGRAVQRRDRPAFDAAVSKLSSLQPPDQQGVLRDYGLPTCAQAFSTG